MNTRKRRCVQSRCFGWDAVQSYCVFDPAGRKHGGWPPVALRGGGAVQGAGYPSESFPLCFFVCAGDVFDWWNKKRRYPITLFALERCPIIILFVWDAVQLYCALVPAGRNMGNGWAI